MRLIAWGVFLLLSAIPVAQAGDIYVCEKNGKKEFSQLPCGDNATVMKDKTEPSSITIAIPMPEKDITRLCQLVIQAKDRYVAVNAYNESRRYSRYNNYNSYNSYRSNRENNSNSPQAYVLSHITNLEQLAGKSPQTYDLLKSLVNHVDYQGYDQSPIYQAERAAAQTECEQHVTGRLEDISRN